MYYKHNIAAFYEIWKKYNDIQFTKKMDLINRKIENHPPSPSVWNEVMNVLN